MITKRLIIFMAALIFCTSALADSPLALPEPSHVCSANGIYCAMSDPVKNITTLTKKGNASVTRNIPGWHRWVLVSNEGNTVIGYGGLNLLPPDVKLNQPLIVFYKKDQRVNTITLGQLFKNKAQLSRTVSHLAWLNTMGFNAQNKLSLELIDGRKIIFDSNTGLVVSEH